MPEDTTDVVAKPNCRAAATAVAEERSFTVPVGFAPSNFRRSRRTPSWPGQPGSVQQRRVALAERDPVGGIGDRQYGGVAPQAAATQAGGPLAAEPVEVVGELEQAAAALALQGIAKGDGGAAVDAGQPAGQRLGHHGAPRAWITLSISSTRCRSVCSASARRRALSPMARASSGRVR